MTKSPLEIKCEEMAGEYECAVQYPERKWNENDYKYRDYEAGFKAALELPEIKALEDKLDHIAVLNRLGPYYSVRGPRLAQEALTKWRKFKGEEK